MADGFWPEARASIVLLPSGEQGDGLLDLAAEWTKMGLLGPALWVLPEQVSGNATAPPRILAAVLGVGADLEIHRIEVDLFEALAQEPLAVVRLVKLRSAAASREIDAAQDAIADRVQEWVRKSMPLAAPGASVLDQSAELRHATLICAPTQYQLRQRVDWATREFGTVVVASPEDRSSPWSGDAFVRDDARFVGFTLLHLASVAGLWNGVPTGSFELVRREESGHRNVWISRVFLNAVLTESLGRRTAAAVLEDAARPGSLLVDPSSSAPPPGTVFIPETQVNGYIDDMVDGAMTLDDGALAFRPAEGGLEPTQRRIGFWAQLGSFLVFSGDKLIRMPAWGWRWATSRTYRKTTRTLHSEEGSMIVGPELQDVFDVRERELIADAARVKDDEARARTDSQRPAALAHVHTTPELWARLRQLVFGSLDGSADLSDLGFRPSEDGIVPIFGRVSDVLALPDDPWRPSRESVPDDFPEQVDWYFLTLDDPRGRLVAAAAESAAERARADAELEHARHASEETPADTGDQETVPPGEQPAKSDDVDSATAEEGGVTASDSEESEGVEHTGDESASHGDADSDDDDHARRFEASQARVRAAQIDETRRAEALRDYDRWASQQSRSFIWRLMDRMSAERRVAAQKADALSQAIDGVGAPSPGRLIALRRRFHRTMLITWLICAGLAAIVLLIMFGVTRQSESSPDGDPSGWYTTLWVILGIVLGIAIAVTLGALIAYHLGWSRFQRDIELERHRLAQLAVGAQRARQEAVRLESVHRQAVDWLVLLSRAIHRPWHVPEEWKRRDQLNTARESMPFALQIAAVQDDDHAAAARLRRVMTDSLLVKGWRHDAFAAFVEEIAADRGAGSSFGLRTLDEDLPHSSNHTRRMLLAAMDDEHLLTRVAGPRLEHLVRVSQRDEAATSRPRVRPVVDNPLAALRHGPLGRNGNGGVGWDEFLLASIAGRPDVITPLSINMLTDVELGERHHERVQSHLVVPQRVAQTLRRTDVGGADVVAIPETGAAPVELSWRVDIAGPVPVRAIHLWDESAAEAAVAAEIGDLGPTAYDDEGI